MKKRWMVQAFALALTGVLVFGTGAKGINTIIY